MKAVSKIKEENVVFFDIETARGKKEYSMDEDIFEAWRYKKKKENLSDEELMESLHNEAALHPEFGRVVSVVLGGIRKGTAWTMTFDDFDEKKLLEDVNDKLNSAMSSNASVQLCGWNIKGFDMMYLFRRMMIHGIPPAYIIDTGGDKPWEINSIDLMELWRAGAFGNVPFVACTTALGLPSPKDDIDGSEVSDAFWRGEIARISTYCRKDVLGNINVFRKFQFKEPIPEAKELIATEDVQENQPALIYLFEGGKFDMKRENELKSVLDTLNDDEKFMAGVILMAAVERGKDNFTNTHTKDLLNGEEKES